MSINKKPIGPSILKGIDGFLFLLFTWHYVKITIQENNFRGTMNGRK